MKVRMTIEADINDEAIAVIDTSDLPLIVKHHGKELAKVYYLIHQALSLAEYRSLSLETHSLKKYPVLHFASSPTIREIEKID